MKALLLSLAIITLSQSVAFPQDSASHYRKISLQDTIRSFGDTIVKSSKQLFHLKQNEIKQKGKGLFAFKKYNQNLKHSFGFDSSRVSAFHNLFKDLLPMKPAVGIKDGSISYQFNYWQNVDTPFFERNVAQHNLLGRLNFFVAGSLPFTFSYWVRRTNSNLYSDITDVQLTFNASEFGNQIQSALKGRLLSIANRLRDSLSEQLLGIKLKKLAEVQQWLKHPMQMQRLIECNEILNVPRITYNPSLSDSINARRADSLQSLARLFIDLYNNTSGQILRIQSEVDSLEDVVKKSLEKVKQFKDMIQSGGFTSEALGALKNKMNEFGLRDLQIPAKYKWLMGIRQFSLGRSLVNHSELTAKNISVKGINFEYNSWYYLAVAAGVVDYRFRDFITSPFKKTPQFLFLARAGIGRLNGTHFIASIYRGEKQLYSATSAGRSIPTLTVSGLSFETRWKITRTSWLSAEVAESITEDFRNNPQQPIQKFDFSNQSNKAWAFRLFSLQPKLGLRIDGMYKYTGANFHSFNSYQTSAALKAWYIKAEQSFWKRQIRINAALRNNDYFNPLIQQQYSSNTIFKTITATLRRRKWPVLTIGYQPMSQLTKVGNQVFENRFQTLTVSAYYLYKVDKRQAATTIVYNQFYNSISDTGYIYFNAVNVNAYQNFFFKHFNANAGVSFMKNSSYELVLLDGSVQRNFMRLGHLGFGVKINNYNRSLTKVGGYVQAGLRIASQDILSLQFERGWLPGMSKGLVQNDLGTIQFTKTFRFRKL
jgi:hypothetical protein